ncbi:MAG TPA: hypothetical protein VI727_06500 [Candidatus Brocadiaceae bacterium]|nr:hypothetical protein [Candidatus Brocadiaceae bacterium]
MIKLYREGKLSLSTLATRLELSVLEKFQNTESTTPVVASTVGLLTTSVDAPSVRNVVFVKPVSSIVSFKQIAGRGSRLCPDTEKFWFRVIDYTNASRLFDEWDKPGEPPEGGQNTIAPFECVIDGQVVDSETKKPLTGAHVVLQTGPNDIIDQRTWPDGRFFFSSRYLLSFGKTSSLNKRYNLACNGCLKKSLTINFLFFIC